MIHHMYMAVFAHSKVRSSFIIIYLTPLPFTTPPLGGGLTVQYTEHVSRKCTPETYIILVTSGLVLMRAIVPRSPTAVTV